MKSTSDYRICYTSIMNKNTRLACIFTILIVAESAFGLRLYEDSEGASSFPPQTQNEIQEDQERVKNGLFDLGGMALALGLAITALAEGNKQNSAEGSVHGNAPKG